jgi:hypothetical protein
MPISEEILDLLMRLLTPAAARNRVGILSCRSILDALTVPQSREQLLEKLKVLKEAQGCEILAAPGADDTHYDLHVFILARKLHIIIDTKIDSVCDVSTLSLSCFVPLCSPQCSPFVS